jgi:serine/threonine protein phosphatase PrpC
MSASPSRVEIGQRYGETDTGRKRRRNEDSFVCDPPLFAVADGMGGAQAGELASALAASALRERGDREPGGETQIVELVQEANRRVHQRALDDASASGMGTTMTVALFGEDDGSVTIGHVGDSRAYRLRDGRLEQLTDDHSLVAELVRRGELSAAEAEVHPQRSVITRALGTDPDVDVDTFTVPALPGDVFLLCSDGLTTMVSAEGIAELVLRHRDNLRSATRALIEAANDHGGDDNVTAVLFEVAKADEPGDTREAPVVVAAPAPVPDPDEADTLHPEDRVISPLAAVAAADGEPPAEPREAAADDTVIVSAAELYAVQAAGDGPAEASVEAPVDGAADDPAELAGWPPPEPARTLEAVSAAEGEEPEAGDADHEPPAPLWRKALALLVIVVLVGVILLLVTRGLAR